MKTLKLFAGFIVYVLLSTLSSYAHDIHSWEVYTLNSQETKEVEEIVYQMIAEGDIETVSLEDVSEEVDINSFFAEKEKEQAISGLKGLICTGALAGAGIGLGGLYVDRVMDHLSPRRTIALVAIRSALMSGLMAGTIATIGGAGIVTTILIGTGGLIIITGSAMAIVLAVEKVAHILTSNSIKVINDLKVVGLKSIATSRDLLKVASVGAVLTAILGYVFCGDVYGLP